MCAECCVSAVPSWRYDHAAHHATAGTSTAAAGATSPPDRRRVPPGRRARWYRLMRNPFAMLAVGPLTSLLLKPRVNPTDHASLRAQVIATDVAILLLVVALCALVGWRDVLLVSCPLACSPAPSASGSSMCSTSSTATGSAQAGVDLRRAALHGSSHLHLPQPLQSSLATSGCTTCTTSTAVFPNYNLQRAHDENPIFRGVADADRCGTGSARMRLQALRRRARVACWLSRRQALSDRWCCPVRSTSRWRRYSGEAVPTARCLALAFVLWLSVRRERRGVGVRWQSRLRSRAQGARQRTRRSSRSRRKSPSETRTRRRRLGSFAPRANASSVGGVASRTCRKISWRLLARPTHRWSPRGPRS